MVGSVVNGYTENTATREILEKSARTAALFTLLGTDYRENILTIVSQTLEILEAAFSFYLPAGGEEAPVFSGWSLPEEAQPHLISWADKIPSFPDEDGVVLLNRESLPAPLDCQLLACIPIQTDQRPVGVLAAGFEVPREFDPDDRQAARYLAGALALQHRISQRECKARIGTVARQMAHDLNNILSGLVSYPELILMQMEDNSPLKNPISLMHESGIQAAEMVQDFLIIARPTDQQTFYPISPSDSARAYCQSSGYTALAMRFPSVRFSFFIDPDLPKIQGSEEFLPKILTTLLGHAAQNTAGQGQVNVTLKEDPTEKGVVLIVEDNGPETDRKTLARLFEPFYTKKTMGRLGSGLGLSAIKKLIQDQGGAIHAGTVPGQGNRFDVFLPAVPTAT